MTAPHGGMRCVLQCPRSRQPAAADAPFRLIGGPQLPRRASAASVELPVNHTPFRALRNQTATQEGDFQILRCASLALAGGNARPQSAFCPAGMRCVRHAPPLMTLLREELSRRHCCARREMGARVMPRARWPSGWRRDRQAVRLVLLASCCISSGLRPAALTVSAHPGGASDHRRTALAHAVATDCTRDVDVSRDHVGFVWDVRGRCRRLLRPRARSIPRPRHAINDSGFSPGPRHWSAPRRLPARARRPPARE